MPGRRGLDRKAVVDAAVELLNAGGTKSLTLNRLAKKLGVQPPSLYNHIDGLPGLYANCRCEMRSCWVSGLARPRSVNPARRLYWRWPRLTGRISSNRPAFIWLLCRPPAASPSQMKNWLKPSSRSWPCAWRSWLVLVWMERMGCMPCAACAAWYTDLQPWKSPVDLGCRWIATRASGA